MRRVGVELGVAEGQAKRFPNPQARARQTLDHDPQAARSSSSRETPRFIHPMAARVVDELPEGDGWIYEVKFDGYRALLIKHFSIELLIQGTQSCFTRSICCISSERT
jgi:ATP-dependent DNA ligase